MTEGGLRNEIHLIALSRCGLWSAKNPSKPVLAKILSGLNAFEISNLQEQETESRYPGDRDVTM
jgi:hypothetical protein